MKDRNACLRVLGLDSHAGAEEIRQAYKDLVVVWHPDRFAHNPRLRVKAETRLKEINAAYAWLHANPAIGDRSSQQHKPSPRAEKPPGAPYSPGDTRAGPGRGPDGQPRHSNTKQSADAGGARPRGSANDASANVGGPTNEKSSGAERPSQTTAPAPPATKGKYMPSPLLWGLFILIGAGLMVLKSAQDPRPSRVGQQVTFRNPTTKVPIESPAQERSQTGVNLQEVPAQVLSAIESSYPDEVVRREAHFSRVDIDRDGLSEWLVSEVPGYCGSGGCTHWLLRVEGEGARNLLGVTCEFGLELEVPEGFLTPYPDIYMEHQDKIAGEFTVVRYPCKWENGLYR